jgi:hypothetical protein
MNFTPHGQTVLLSANATSKSTQVFANCSSFLFNNAAGGNTVFVNIGLDGITVDHPVVNTATTLTANTASGNANAKVTTVTYAAQANVPFATGSYVTLSGFTPSAYNGYFPVVSANLTTVKVTSTATGNVTVLGNVSQPIINGTNSVPVLAGVPVIVSLTKPLTQPAVVTIAGITVSGTGTVYITPGTGS